jgi:hypothetical protein
MAHQEHPQRRTQAQQDEPVFTFIGVVDQDRSIVVEYGLRLFE